MDRANASKLAAGTLLVGASLLSGNAALITAAGGVGVNWASEALGDVWRTAVPPIQAGSPLARAYERALRRAVTDLRKQYQGAYGKQQDLKAFELVSAGADSVALAEYPTGIVSAETAQRALARSLDGLLHGHDERQVAWIKARLLEQTALAFQHELASDPEAWRLFHGWLTQQIAGHTAALSQALRELPRVLDALRNPTAMLGALDDATARLEAMLDDLREELRRIATGSGAPPVPARTHSQTIGDSAQVGVAVAGDVHGPITHVQQSGGINFGSGNTIGSIGDIVAGDKVSGDKVLGDKVVNYGAPRPAETSPDHVRRLIDLHTRRLRVLEEQAALSGYNARPEVRTEIDDIRAEIARLEALLKP